MKRILIFSTAYHPFIGGAEISVKEITDRISDIGFDMITAKMDSKLPHNERIGNVQVYRVGVGWKIDKYLLPLLGYCKALKLHREKKYDCMWSIMASYAAFPCLFFKLTYKQIPYILTLQEGDPIEDILRKVRLIRPLFNQIFLKADYIHAISTFLEKWAKEMGYSGETSVIPNGFNAVVFDAKPTKGEIQEIKERIEGERGDRGVFFDEKTRLMISTSRLVKKNGLDTAIQSLVTLPENIKFIIIGDGPLKEKLQMWAKQRGVRDRVHFIGAIPYEKLYTYLKLPEVFVFVRPARSEGMGNSFIEAMAAGVPVVATPVGGITDFIEDGKTGLYAIPDDHQSVSSAVRRYYENEELREEIIKNGKAFVRKSYKWDDVTNRMKEMFNKVML